MVEITREYQDNTEQFETNSHSHYFSPDIFAGTEVAKDKLHVTISGYICTDPQISIFKQVELTNFVLASHCVSQKMTRVIQQVNRYVSEQDIVDTLNTTFLNIRLYGREARLFNQLKIEKRSSILITGFLHIFVQREKYKQKQLKLLLTSGGNAGAFKLLWRSNKDNYANN